MKKPLINFKTARIIEIVSIALMLILSGLTALLELSKAFLAVSIVGGLTVYVVTASLFDRCPRCGRNLDRVSLLRDDFCPRCGAPLCEEERPARTTETACAKVNLTLSVGEKRPDGYHEVETAMTGVGLYDTVTLYRNAGPWDKLECDPPVTERAGDNLCMKALRVFFEEFGPKKDFVTIRLEKTIPTQAGLGGGSSDAAAVLRGLRTLYVPDMTDTQLEEVAAQLGSDVPFFIRGGTALATGRGEKLSALPDMPPCWLVIVKPEESHSTAAMYAAIDSAPQRVSGDSRAVREGLEKGDLSAVAAGLGNDFQQVLPEDSAVPAIVEALRQRGVLNAQMTGSGSAVFGLFRRREEAEAAAETLKETYPRTFCVSKV